MTPEEWREVKDGFQTALALDPEERANYLDSAFPNGDLRGEVESLLRSHDDSAAFLDQAVEVIASDIPPSTTTEFWIGKRLGPYQVLEQIGKGGMSVVFRACRVDDQFQKQVAIKVLRAGEASPFVVGRFRNERQILAGLDHPNIARLTDGGTTEEGIPYLVMDLVEGVPIDDYCDARKLPTTQRLKLFVEVCSAVQYAHQRLIVHRDLKPGNILVTGQGVPKLLDFGIAKILGQGPLAGRSETTLTLFRILTPGYASPEQVRGEPITTASDVYSLGVILYELLTGRSPYGNRKRTSEEISNAVCELDPEKPSDVVTHAIAGNAVSSPAEIAELREGSAQKLLKRLRGDLDNIVMMALQKEPQRRYASVEQFAADIGRHLDSLPVFARKDTARYRLSKFVVRHKAGVAAASAVVLTMIMGFIITIREARIAERRFNDVRALANSLIFDVHDSIRDLPGSTPARKIIVDRALQYLNSLAQESSGDIALQRELATAYERVGLVQGHYTRDNLGDTKSSLDSYQKALSIRERIDRKSRDWKDHLALARCYRFVAELQGAVGKPDEFRKAIGRSIAISATLNQSHRNDTQLLYEMACEYRTSGSLEDNRKALAADEVALKLLGDDLPTLDGYARDWGHLGAYFESTDPRTALWYYQKELEILQKLNQKSDAIQYRRALALAYRDLGAVYEDLGDQRQSHEYDIRYLAVLQEISRTDPQNASLRQSLAIAYGNTALDSAILGKSELALEESAKGLEIMRALVASAPENIAQHHYLAAIVEGSGTVFLKVHKPEAAVRQFREARTIYESLGSSYSGAFDQASAVACGEKMGEASALSGNTQLASSYFQQALREAGPMISAHPPDLLALYLTADAYFGLGELSLKKAHAGGQTPEARKANWTEAMLWFAKSVDTWHRIAHPIASVSGTALYFGDPASVEKRLNECKRTLAAFH
jgi:serine/threonine protein kinase